MISFPLPQARSLCPHLLAEPAGHAISYDTVRHHVLLADVVALVEEALTVQVDPADLGHVCTGAGQCGGPCQFRVEGNHCSINNRAHAAEVLCTHTAGAGQHTELHRKEGAKRLQMCGAVDLMLDGAGGRRYWEGGRKFGQTPPGACCPYSRGIPGSRNTWAGGRACAWEGGLQCALEQPAEGSDLR